jgi:hypothetical protein
MRAHLTVFGGPGFGIGLQLLEPAATFLDVCKRLQLARLGRVCLRTTRLEAEYPSAVTGKSRIQQKPVAEAINNALLKYAAMV